MKTFSFISAILLALTVAGCDVEEQANSGVYDVDLRTMYKEYNPETKKFEWVERQWRMDIPREYILDTKGRNGFPSQNPENSFKNQFKMKLSVLIDLESMTITADPNMRRHVPYENKLDIYLSNGRPVDRILNTEGSEKLCYTYVEQRELTGRQPPRHNHCNSTKKLCRLDMYVDGWPVRMSISRELYENPQPYCDVARQFLDELTVSRDNQAATFQSIMKEYENKTRDTQLDTP